MRARAAKTFPRGTGHPSENSGASAFRFCPLHYRFPAGAIRPARRAKGAGPDTRRQTAMGKRIDERSHEAIRAYLRHRGIEVLEEGWAHGSDSIGFIAMDDGELVFVDAATKCGGYDMPREEPDQERFERIAAAYLAEAEVEGLTNIRYDIVIISAFLLQHSTLHCHNVPHVANTWQCDVSKARERRTSAPLSKVSLLAA